MAHRISTYSPLHVDEINEPNNIKRKAEKKLREIENLKKLSAHTPEQRNKLAREQEWRDILNPPPPPTFHEPPKQTNKQRKKEKEREAKKKRAEEIRIQKEAREQQEKETREKYQREYKTRQEEFHRKWREQEERKQKERDDLQQNRDAALGKYKNDPLAIDLYNAFNTPLAIHLLTEYGEVNNKSDNRNAYIRLSRKYHPDKTGGTTTEQQKIIGFIRDYLQDKMLSNLS